MKDQTWLYCCNVCGMVWGSADINKPSPPDDCTTCGKKAVDCGLVTILDTLETANKKPVLNN